MTKKNVNLIILIIVVFLVIILFATGSPILTKDFIGIPIGNLLLWIGFVALQLTVYFLNNGFKKSKSSLGKFIRYVMLSLIIVSILWFGIAYILAGNTRFNFSSGSPTFFGSAEASRVHWGIIYLLGIGPIISMLIYKLLSYFELKKEGG